MTAFEEHMLVDDRPSHPMVIVARLDFTGQAPVPALASAFDRVIRGEPLLTARVARPRFRRRRWLPGPLPLLHTSNAASPPGPADMPIPRLDPQHGPMMHAEVIAYPEGWSIVLAVHHAACDGLGLVGFIERWLLAAAGQESRRPREAANVVACLRARGRVAGSWRGFLRMLPGLRVGLAGVRQFIARRVVGLGGQAAATAATGAEPWRPTILVAAIDAATYAEVEARAKADGVTVNDLLAAAFITAIADAADDARDPAIGDGWVRLSVPTSLRAKSDYLLPAANRVSMVFLDRQREQCHDRHELVAGIHAEMELIRVHALGHILPMSLEVGRLAPGGLARAAKNTKPQATAVLSNLGRCFHRSPLADDDGRIRIGESHMTGWWIVPPVRPGTPLAVATHETSGHRTIAAHVDTAAFEPAAAAVTLARFAERLREFARVSPPSVNVAPEMMAS